MGDHLALLQQYERKASCRIHAVFALSLQSRLCRCLNPDDLRETPETDRGEEVDGEASVGRIVSWHQTLKERLKRPTYKREMHMYFIQMA